MDNLHTLQFKIALCTHCLTFALIIQCKCMHKLWQVAISVITQIVTRTPSAVRTYPLMLGNIVHTLIYSTHRYYMYIVHVLQLTHSTVLLNVLL